ncbi:MAG: hypothetical protein ROW39_10555 [Anaerolineaceae bacterium]
MAERIFFQWQNPILLKTIYPMREQKLRDFLLFDYEVQLWEKYYPLWLEFKDRLPDGLKEQAKLFLEKEKDKLRQAVQVYETDLKALRGEVVLDPQHDPIKRIIPAVRVMHQIFAQRFEGFIPAKQANYLRDRVAEFSGLLQEVERQISNKQRAIRNNGPEWAARSGYPAIVQLLIDFTRPMVEQELSLIRRYQAAYERMAGYEKQRLADAARLQQQQKAAEKEFKALDLEAQKRQDELTAVLEEMQRYRGMQRVEDHQDHFLNGDIKARYRSEFGQVDEDMLDQIQRIHRQIRDHFRQPGLRADFLNGRVRFLQSILRLPPPNKVTAAARRAIGQKELDRLMNFQLAFARAENPQAVLNRLAELEARLPALEAGLQEIKEKQRGPKAALEEIARSLNIPRGEQMIAMVDQKQVRILDIVNDLIDTRRHELQQKNAAQLLEEIVQLFVRNPTKYPLWLQYMVVHFSGMRYKSAHGSWQDPRRLLLELRKQKFLPGAEAQGLENLSDEQALEKLAALEGRLPPWAWREAVRLTDLKLEHVKDESWERLTQPEIDEMYRPASARLRQALFDWKKVITTWREEHQRSKRLIVTSAVCNEVAEHIQHLRGIKPPGGLTAKPRWYIEHEALGAQNPLNERPYFIKPKNAAAFKQSASIFWLRWVRKLPNEAQITRPLVLRSGEPLVPLENTHPKITMGNNEYKRVVRVIDRDAAGNILGERDEEQWLRWMHEAIVVKVIDSAEGTLVFTFETSLPGEPRSQSTMGISRRYVAHLIHNFPADELRGTFVGYVPDGRIPFDQIKGMLDWNHILQRAAFNEAEIASYWQQVQVK